MATWKITPKHLDDINNIVFNDQFNANNMGNLPLMGVLLAVLDKNISAIPREELPAEVLFYLGRQDYIRQGLEPFSLELRDNTEGDGGLLKLPFLFKRVTQGDMRFSLPDISRDLWIFGTLDTRVHNIFSKKTNIKWNREFNSLCLSILFEENENEFEGDIRANLKKMRLDLHFIPQTAPGRRLKWGFDVKFNFEVASYSAQIVRTGTSFGRDEFVTTIKETFEKKAKEALEPMADILVTVLLGLPLRQKENVGITDLDANSSGHVQNILEMEEMLTNPKILYYSQLLPTDLITTMQEGNINGLRNIYARYNEFNIENDEDGQPQAVFDLEILDKPIPVKELELNLDYVDFTRKLPKDIFLLNTLTAEIKVLQKNLGSDEDLELFKKTGPIVKLSDGKYYFINNIWKNKFYAENDETRQLEFSCTVSNLLETSDSRLIKGGNKIPWEKIVLPPLTFIPSLFLGTTASSNNKTGVCKYQLAPVQFAEDVYRRIVGFRNLLLPQGDEFSKRVPRGTFFKLVAYVDGSAAGETPLLCVGVTDPNYSGPRVIDVGWGTNIPLADYNFRDIPVYLKKIDKLKFSFTIFGGTWNQLTRTFNQFEPLWQTEKQINKDEPTYPHASWGLLDGAPENCYWFVADGDQTMKVKVSIRDRDFGERPVDFESVTKLYNFVFDRINVFDASEGGLRGDTGELSYWGTFKVVHGIDGNGNEITSSDYPLPALDRVNRKAGEFIGLGGAWNKNDVPMYPGKSNVFITCTGDEEDPLGPDDDLETLTYENTASFGDGELEGRHEPASSDMQLMFSANTISKPKPVLLQFQTTQQRQIEIGRGDSIIVEWRVPFAEEVVLHIDRRDGEDEDISLANNGVTADLKTYSLRILEQTNLQLVAKNKAGETHSDILKVFIRNQDQ